VKEKGEFVKGWTQRVLKRDKKESGQPSKDWEFETYIRERLRSLGIIQ
jgi:hypothetical protein